MSAGSPTGVRPPPARGAEVGRQHDRRALRRFSHLAALTSICALVLIVLGGIVRITGSGMGCGDDWPLCNGELIPPLDLPTLIEYAHRLMAAGLGLLVVGLALVAWRSGRSDPWQAIRRLTLVAVALLALQVLLGAVTVWLELPPTSVILHLGTAMLLVAVLILATCRSRGLERRRLSRPDRFSRLAAWMTLFAFLVVLAGALVANLGAAPACQGFPLCNGRFLPAMNSLIVVHWSHRVLAYGLLAASLFLPAMARRARPADRPVRTLSVIVVALVIGQLLVAAAMVLGGLPAQLRAAHVAFGATLFAGFVVLTWLARWVPSGARLVQPGARSNTTGRDRIRAVVRDYVALTKPRIISLLLLTTVIPMFVAGRPSLRLVGWVLVGGYLMAGGANAFNMYLDRDLDARMTRTRLRPIPGGRVSPRRVLGFAFGLALAAFAILAWQANLLAAALALGGLLFYVGVYTRWLKRATPQNIVIGGAAGAFPPLVGWAAVTGTIDLTALCLFLIIFYWTPPHFWALALVKRSDYQSAGVPMAPVVWGEGKTMRQMLIYTLVLLPLTLLPVLFGSMGVLYGLAAIALGVRLLWMVVRLLRETDFETPAWSLYKYSLLYLALLFGAMIVDRTVPLHLTGAASAAPAEASVETIDIEPWQPGDQGRRASS